MVVSGTPNSADNEDGYDIVYVVFDMTYLSVSVCGTIHPGSEKESLMTFSSINFSTIFHPFITAM